ncbi:MAG: hypothetical protein BGO55_14720 [Sphingobacteriales bacterium 50-39]|nr:SusE domain-containing protein [Sphingobacteriales bacterium]OJW57533.1 MAG: hypothetical protein BGO55_14720 [Sphingobacteriales bacterium 50-39]
MQKRYLHKISLACLCSLLLATACKKDEAKLYYQGGTTPALTASASDSVPLHPADSNSTAVTFNWTNPNYQFSDGISSQNVTYYLQIDTAGANFSSPNMQTVAITNDLSKSFTVTQFNTLLGNGLLLALDQPHQIEVRIESFLSSQTATLFSNKIPYHVTPYAPPPAVDTPSSGKLFLVGDATAGGWNNPVPVPSQQFTRISGTEYKITVSLVGGKQYLFIPVNGDWSHKYAGPDTNDSGLNGPSPFKKDGPNNFIGPATSGTYTIDVNFQTGKFTVQ